MSLKNDWTPNDTLKNNNVNDIANATNNNTQHRETKINKDTFVHGLKYNDSKNSLILDSESGEVEIGGAAETEINEHKQKSVLTSDGVHDLKCENNEIFIYKDSAWRLADVTVKHRGTRIIGGDGVHGIKYDVASQKLQYKDNSQMWQDINTGIEEHKNLSIASENGVHNFKYDPDTKSLYYYHDGEWLVAEIEGTGKVSVSGLTADTIKSGVTVVVKRGEEEVTRIVGTFTNDSNAVASDILSGKTAYVSGQKITGNIVTKTGTISVANPTVSGANVITPTIPNGYYTNAKISFDRNNLYENSIKAGVNLWGVTGRFTSDATATAADIISGKTAYVNGSKITGNWIKSDKPVASIAITSVTGATTVYMTSIDSTLLQSQYYAHVTNSSGNRYIYFKRSANIRYYKYGGSVAVDFPFSWTEGTYTVSNNTSITIRAGNNNGTLTVLICEIV